MCVCVCVCVCDTAGAGGYCLRGGGGVIMSKEVRDYFGIPLPDEASLLSLILIGLTFVRGASLWPERNFCSWSQFKHRRVKNNYFGQLAKRPNTLKFGWPCGTFGWP